MGFCEVVWLDLGMMLKNHRGFIMTINKNNIAQSIVTYSNQAHKMPIDIK